MKHKKSIANIMFTIFLVVGIGFLAFGMIGVLGLLPSSKLEVINGATVAFGNTSVGTYLDTNDANAQSVSYFTCTASVPVTDIVAYINGVSSGNAIAAIYEASSTSGPATTLDAQSNSVSIGTTFSWVDFSLPSAFTPIAGSTYGLAIMANAPIQIFEVTGSGQRDHNVGNNGLGSYATGFTNPFGTIWGTDSNGAMSIYAASSSTPTPTPTPAPTPTPSPGSPLYQVTVNESPTTEGTCQVDPAGAQAPMFSYYAGTPISVLAVPNQGYMFNHLDVTAQGGTTLHTTTNPWEQDLESNLAVTAYFVPLTTPTSTPTPTPPPHLPLLSVFQYEFSAVFGFAIAVVSGGSLYLVNKR
jgi:hypothetical protein